MQDVIRLVCPECDAVHRVKNITLGKLYRCKKCKSGLITMTPAVLTCPTCGASKPPSHIEVSRLITCEECEEAPLMAVRFAQNGKGRLTQEATFNKFDTDIRPPEDEPHARQTAHFDPPLPQRANLDRPRRLPEPLPEDMPPPLEAMPDSPAPHKDSERIVRKETAASAADVPPASPTAPEVARDVQEMPELDDSPEEFAKAETAGQTPLPGTSPVPAVNNPTAEPKRYETQDAPAAESAQPANEKKNAPISARNERPAGLSARNAPNADLAFEEDNPEPEEDDQVSLTSANDTVMLKQMGQELLDKASRTLADSYRAEEEAGAEGYYNATRESGATGSGGDFPPLPRQDARGLYPHYAGEDDLGGSYAPAALLADIREIVAKTQQQLAQEVRGGRGMVPLWIPAALALMLFALYGWLLAELDGVRDDLKGSREQIARQEQRLTDESARAFAEKQKLHEILDATNLEKKKLENDLSEMMLKYEMLRKSMHGIPGPELNRE